MSDGAGVVIIASEDAVKKHNFTPLARVVGYFVSGCDPSIMGIGKLVVTYTGSALFLELSLLCHSHSRNSSQIKVSCGKEIDNQSFKQPICRLDQLFLVVSSAVLASKGCGSIPNQGHVHEG